MTKIMVYYKDYNAKDGSTWGEIRVSIVNRFDRVIKDVSYEEFKLMKGHSQIKLQNMKPIIVIG